MTLRIGINGFGRIGRCILRALAGRTDVEVVWINDLTSLDMLAYLLRFDSVHGRFAGSVETRGTELIVDGRAIGTSAIANPADIGWGDHGADVVLECTGVFRDRAKAALHLQAGAKRVVLSAPGKDIDATLVTGVNDQSFDPLRHYIVSNASCTTNCLAPVASVLHAFAGIEYGWMSTVHGYTMDQNLLDAPHRKGDFRRARAAALNMTPTATGAAQAIGLVIPELHGRLDGRAIRVPVPDGSLITLTAQLSRAITRESLLAAFEQAAQTHLNGLLRVSHDPIVGSDIVGDSHSAIIDAEHVGVLGGKLVDIMAWYDNEWAFSHRMIDLSLLVGANL